MSIARRGRVARKSIRDTLADNNKRDRFYAQMAGLPPRAQAVIPEKRTYTKRESKGASEAQVIDAIRAAFAVHPAVAFCWRMQSGLFRDGDRHIRVGFPGLPDLIGALKTGQFFAVEVKREFGGQVSDRQVEVLQSINTAGGRAGVARSVEEALAIIK